MRLREIEANDVPPIKSLSVQDLADVVVFAGPNGVGKTRLVEAILQTFQSPGPGRSVRLVIEATTDEEKRTWGKTELDTAVADDARRLTLTLQRNRRRSTWQSSVIQFESDRSIQQVRPYQFSWEVPDPWEESIGWNMTLGRLRDRFQDTLDSIFRKVQSIRDQIGRKGEALQKQGVRTMELDFPDPMIPFKGAFTQLLAPKQLLDADPRLQQLFYEFEGKQFPLTSLSSGEREVVNIVFDFLLRGPTDSIVVFDEPELHLHPELSYKLLQTLRSAGVNNQFLFCTHSPDIITASLDNSVVFIAPPRDDGANQAIIAREDDETHEALKLLGQSIGIISLGKRIALIEGSHASLDKQVYGAILRGRFANLVLVPSGGKGVITSFGNLIRSVLERTLWGVEFFMLCDRDSVPQSRSVSELEGSSGGRLRVLRRYHLENYFLDEHIISEALGGIEAEDSPLRDPAYVRAKLEGFARATVSYATALAVTAQYRDLVGNVDIMPSACQDKSADELAAMIVALATAEKERINKVLDPKTIETEVKETLDTLNKAFENGSDLWKYVVPGRPVVNRFAAHVGIRSDRFKLMYMRAAQGKDPDPFDEIVGIFASFSQQ